MVILLRVIGFFLVSTALFSLGAVAGIRSRRPAPGAAPFAYFTNLAIVFLCWLAALSAYLAWRGTAAATLIGAVFGLLAGFTLYRLRKQTAEAKSGLGSAGRMIPVLGVASSTPATEPPGGPIQPGWRSFLRQVGGFQSRILLCTFYFIALLPFGMVAGNFGDPLGLKVGPGESFWKRRDSNGQNLEAARRQS
jgi:hypothetical protein